MGVFKQWFCEHDYVYRGRTGDQHRYICSLCSKVIYK